MNLEKTKQKIKGPVFSIITPFTEGGRDVDFEALIRYVKFLYSKGAKAFYVMGYCSRFSVLSDIEIMRVNETVVRTVKEFGDPECVSIIADPLHCSTETSIQFAQHGELIGADIISLLFREKVYFEGQVYEHFKDISDNCNIGMLIHEMSLNNGIPGKPPLINWSLDSLDKVASLKNVIALKEDAKEDDYTRKVSDLVSDRLAIIISGHGMRQWSRFSDSISAWLCGIGGVNPRIELDFYDAWESGDEDKCEKIITSAELPFNEIKDTFGWHLGIKSAMDIMGIMSRQERSPLRELPQADFNKLKQMWESVAAKTPYLSQDAY